MRGLAARAQLEEAIARGLGLPDITHGVPPLDQPIRHSAVLILFGELDQVPAATSAAQNSLPAELDVLLMRRSDGLRNHAGQISFPGGGVEPGDANRVATALREAQEETGLNPDGVDILGELPSILIPVSNYLVTPVVGWWRLPSEVRADFSESVEVFRVPVAELVDPAARGNSRLVRGDHVWEAPAFRLGPQFGRHVVWGFTAILLNSILDAAGWSRPWSRGQVFEVAPAPHARS